MRGCEVKTKWRCWAIFGGGTFLSYHVAKITGNGLLYPRTQKKNIQMRGVVVIVSANGTGDRGSNLPGVQGFEDCATLLLVT
jgi:hypothetical protein